MVAEEVAWLQCSSAYLAPGRFFTAKVPQGRGDLLVRGCSTLQMASWCSSRAPQASLSTGGGWACELRERGWVARGDSRAPPGCGPEKTFLEYLFSISPNVLGPKIGHKVGHNEPLGAGKKEKSAKKGKSESLTNNMHSTTACTSQSYAQDSNMHNKTTCATQGCVQQKVMHNIPPAP